MITKGILLDFGYVIGFPIIGVEWKYLYMDWNGIKSILKDEELKHRLQQNTSYEELEAFFNKEIYNVFKKHEKTDFIDPQSNSLLLNRLHLVFRRPITQQIVDRILDHINTMKYINIDPESIKVIAELKKKGYRLSLVSNMMLPGKLLKAKLQETNALSIFDNIAISSDVGYLKPHPEIFIHTMKQLNLKADELVFIGDTYKQDIVGAKKVGIRTIWLNTRKEPKEIAMNNLPDYEITKLSDLIKIKQTTGYAGGHVMKAMP